MDVPPPERARITIPDLYPDLARLLADYFEGERAREPGARHQDAVLAFALTESHGTLLQTASDARAILFDAGELDAFEQFLRDRHYDFAELGDGVGASDWLADVVMLLGTSV